MYDDRDLLNDKDIAHRAGFSPGWVRIQRYFRRHGKPHVLDIDPVLVGTKPRYRTEDVDAWFAGLKAHKEVMPDGNMQP